MKTDPGSATVALLESVYDAARTLVPDLPTNVAFVLQGTGRGRRGGITLGHYAPGRFRTTDRSEVHEIMIAGETIDSGPVEVLCTVLHEAAHALAQARGIKDTSRQNRYHNQRFVALAEELTLSYDQPENYHLVATVHDEVTPKLLPHATIGYSNVGPTSDTIDVFADVLVRLSNDMPIIGRGKGITVRQRPKRVVHGYLVFTGNPDFYSVRRTALSGYEGLRPFLAPHVLLTSTADQGLVEAVLSDLGLSTDADRYSDGYRYDYDDIETVHPELIDLYQTLTGETP